MLVWGTSSGWVPLLLLLAALPAAWLSLMTWQRRRLPGAMPLALAALVAAGWCLLAALQSTSNNPGVQLFFASLEYVAQALLPVLWLLAVVEFTGHEPRMRRALPLLLIIPAVTVALAFTYRWHGLLLPANPGGSYGPWDSVQTVYTTLLMATSFGLLALAWLGASPRQRGQLTMLLVCQLVPLAWIGIGAFQQIIGPGFAIGPLALAFSALIIVWGLLSFRLFDVAPLGQQAVFDALPDAVVVVDLNRCLADFNPAAARLFGWSSREQSAAREGHGQPAALALADWPMLAAALGGEALPGELVTGLGARQRVFEPSLTPLADAHGRSVGQVLTVRDATEHRRIEDELARLATTDDLTGLADRRHLFEALGDEVRRARRYEAPLALLVLDVDGFKALNDRLGRQAGDEALRAVARAIQRLARQSDLPARQAGDEFALILPHTNLLGAETVAGRLVAAANQIQVAAPNQVQVGTTGAEPARLTLSVGAVELEPDDDEQGESLLARAERAVRAAQQAGGGRVMVEERV